jgi:hypothetical protein
VLTVTCKGLGFSLTKGKPVIGYSDTDTATAHITAFLALQETALITLGGVDPVLDKTFLLAIASGKNIWQACPDVRDTVGGYLYVDFDPAAPTTWRLWLKSVIGENKGQQIRENKNMLGVTVQTDYIPYFNKLYPVGASALYPSTKTFTLVNAVKSSDATYGYLTLAQTYGAYKDWTAVGAALPANVTISKAGGGWVTPTSAINEVGGSPSGSWAHPEWAIDGNLSSNANRILDPGAYTIYLECTFDAIASTQVQIYSPECAIETSIYYGGAWHVVQGYAIYGAGWNIITFPQQTITGVRFMAYNFSSTPAYARIREVQVWSATGYTNVSASWKQGADERSCRCAIADYDASTPYVISYTHAAYLISLPQTDRTLICSTDNSFSTANVDTLIEQARVYLDEIKVPVLSVDVNLVDLSVEEGREWEELQLGSLVNVTTKRGVTYTGLPVVRIDKPDIESHPEQIHIEVGSRFKDILDEI